MSSSIPLSASLLRFYRGDGLFRSSLDFAAIGMAVYLFVAPLPLPSFDWLAAPGARQGGPAVTGSGQAVTSGGQSSAVSPVGIAQAANAHNGQTGHATKIPRQWFTLSDPAIRPMLTKAADLLDENLGSSALAVLDALARPDDPNVANLSAYAYLQMHERDRMQRAYEAHLRAAKAGHPVSMDQVGQMLRLGTAGHADLAAAVDWYEKGAAAGDLDAATNAGRAYVNGWARQIDHARAVAYYRQAAEGGEPWGMHNLGAGYINGQGVPTDAAEGRRWIEKAAATGLAAAQISLAKLARKGIGGPRDIDGFVRWAQEAANQGHVPALYELGMFYLEPDDARPADAVRAAGYLRQAALNKDAAAAFAYATLCERGVGTSANPIQAFIFYSLALRGGEKAARDRLDAMRPRMSVQDLETAQKLVAAASS